MFLIVCFGPLFEWWLFPSQDSLFHWQPTLLEKMYLTLSLKELIFSYWFSFHIERVCSYVQMTVFQVVGGNSSKSLKCLYLHQLQISTFFRSLIYLTLCLPCSSSYCGLRWFVFCEGICHRDNGNLTVDWPAQGRIGLPISFPFIWIPLIYQGCPRCHRLAKWSCRTAHPCEPTANFSSKLLLSKVSSSWVINV